MSTRFMSTRPWFVATALGIGASAAFSGVSRAQSYVDDTRGMAGNGSWNANTFTFIGGQGAPFQANQPHDMQLASDFTLTSRTRLTRVTLDMIETVTGSQGPSGGYLVEVFANVAGGHPAETPTISRLVPAAAAAYGGLFTNSTAPSQSPTNVPGGRTTWIVELAASDIVIDPGIWWLSVTPKNDGDSFGSDYRSVGNYSTLGTAPAHRRCGGVDHGNQFPCPLYSNTNTWQDWRLCGIDDSSPSTLSRRIEGEEVQQSQGACCTGRACTIVAGAAAGSGGAYQGDSSACGAPGNPTTCCPANYNGTNGVTVQDIFDFLSGWFSAVPAADFNHVNGITVQDIFDFLAAWFSGC